MPSSGSGHCREPGREGRRQPRPGGEELIKRVEFVAAPLPGGGEVALGRSLADVMCRQARLVQTLRDWAAE